MVCKNRKKLHLRHWTGPLRLVDEWLTDVGYTYLPTFQRPNSPPLNRRISNSMKLVDVLVHIDNYNLTNFH